MTEAVVRKSQIRRGIIGHTSFAFAECFPWKSALLPNFSDFGELIVDLRTLGAATTLRTDDVTERLRGGIYRQVIAGGTSVVIIDRPLRRVATLGNSRKVEIELKLAIPLHGVFAEESGRSITTVTDKHFHRYLKELKEFAFHFTGFSEMPLVSAPATKPVSVEPICVNHEKTPVAAMIRMGGGLLYILPDVPAYSAGASIEMIFEDLTGLSVKSTAPDWIGEVAVQGVSEVDSEIHVRRANIQAITQEIETYSSQRDRLMEFSELTYADGSQLEKRVRAALELLGGTMKPAAFSEEEYILSFEGRDYLVEVKGVTKGAQLEHVGQIVQHLMTAEQLGGTDMGALLVVNAWKTSRPSERIGPLKPPVADNVSRRATTYRVPIVTGMQLLAAVNATLKDRATGPKILRSLLSSSGAVSDEKLFAG